MKLLSSYCMRVPAVSLSVFLSFGLMSAYARADEGPTHTEADNSRVNVRDQKSTALTADDQTSRKDDVELVRKIRRSLTSDSSLSVNAQNIKIISHAGNIILKGPVKSADERAVVERAAQNIAGKDNVSSEINVVSK